MSVDRTPCQRRAWRSRVLTLTTEKGTASTVWHAPGREYRVGVEEELMLLDPDTLAPAAAIESLMSSESEQGPAKRELMQCQVEITAGPCEHAEGVYERLVEARGQLRRDASIEGVLVAAAGTHPLALAEAQSITVGDRYRELLYALRFAARRTLCFGMHVHVSVGGSEKAIQVSEAITADLPLLLALSGSSPFYAGEETGLVSTRLLILQNMPRVGVPPAFESYRDFESTVERLRRAGAISDYTYLWWDIRPQPRLGTIEIRIMDVQPHARDSAALAGFVQAVVRHYGKQYDRGVGFAKVNRLIAAENRWLAMRHGLRARLVTDGDEPAGARDLINELLDRVEADAAALGNEEALDRVAEILSAGTSADRQLRLFRAGQSLEEILSEVVVETAAA
jgi:carboxylate-amine ligase